MDKCSRCQKSLNEEVGLDPFHDWLKVMHYLEILNTEGDISDATWDTLTNAMMSVRPDKKD